MISGRRSDGIVRIRQPSSKLATVRLLPSVHGGLFGALTGIVVVTGVGPVAVIALVGVIIGAVSDAASAANSSAAQDRAMIAFGAVCFLFVALQAASTARVAVADALGMRLEQYLHNRLIKAVTGVRGIGHLEDPQSHACIAQARELGMNGRRVGDAVAAIASKASTRIVGVSCALLLAMFQWWLGAGLLAVWTWAAKEQRRHVLDTTQILSRTHQSVARTKYVRNLVLDRVDAMEVRLFGLSEWLLDRFRQESDQMLGLVWQERSRIRWPWVASTLAAGCASFLALIFLGRSAAVGTINLEEFTRFVGAVVGLSALVHMGPDNHRIEYGTTAVPAVQAVERLAVAHSSRLTSGSRAVPSKAPTREIRFDRVSFTYPGTQSPALSNFDLILPAGQSTAIVGANGSGKSTLIKLLCGFYDPDAGRITVDGDDLRTLRVDEWQRTIAAVFQEFVHYPCSAYDNIAFGAVERMGDDAAVKAAAFTAGADFLRRLRTGYNTPLTKARLGGTDLSGGQWQRVALARALFAANAGARVLVLDEPTAKLDPRAEAAFFDRFLDVTAGLTSVIVSHRFATVRRAASIVVLAHGQVVDIGTHDQLVGAGGVYARMFRAQGPVGGSSRA